MRTMRWVVGLVAAAAASGAVDASAFCGFYAGSASSELTASASQVVLFRDGTRTVMTMRNHYEGPPEDFALVVPVPEVIAEEQVRALEGSVFDRLDTLTAPRVVEYREAPPICPLPRGARVPRIRTGNASVVTVEAEYTLAEYDIVVLGATDAAELTAWLRARRYRVPDGASEALRPYVDAGSRFFVARVAADRVRFDGGRAVLSPLRVEYDSPRLSLPVRLGTLNSRGEQDLIVYVVSRDGRYEVANRPNLLAPTNVVVAPAAIGRLGALYESLFAGVMREHPDAAVTEYAWAGASCDPCPAGALPIEDLNALGGDVARGGVEEAVGPPRVDVVELRRLSGRAASARGLRERIERQLERVDECVAGRRGRRGESVVTLDVAVSPAGRLGVRREDARAPGVRGCLARRLRGIRVHSPPLGVTRSRWRLALSPSRTVVRRQVSAAGFTLTRIRTRTRKDGRVDDLVFRTAGGIVGGREPPDATGALPARAELAPHSTFQSRFVVLHRGAFVPACERPRHGGWRAVRPRSAAGADPPPGTGDEPLAALVLGPALARPPPRAPVRRERQKRDKRIRPSPG